MENTWPSIIWMASRLNSVPARVASAAIIAMCLAPLAPSGAAACPFCVALEPTLAQKSEAARASLIGEVLSTAKSGSASLKVHRVLTGEKVLAGKSDIEIKLAAAPQSGTLVVLFGDGRDGDPLEKLTWTWLKLDEASYAYLARLPLLKVPQPERLAYFARFLEHADPLLARDAYLEFAHASFADVEAVADKLPLARLREWIGDERMRPERKGFFALALGLARDPADRVTNAELLKKLILDPEDDFRAGFDGIIGGYLLLAGEPGLELIESRYMANPAARDGDVRHAVLAVRFYYEFGRDIPRERLCRAIRNLLARPEFAAAAITDLARWQDWQPLARIAALYENKAYAEPAIRRAIVGYLLTSPQGAAGAALARLRAADPEGVGAAEQAILRAGSVGASER